MGSENVSISPVSMPHRLASDKGVLVAASRWPAQVVRAEPQSTTDQGSMLPLRLHTLLNREVRESMSHDRRFRSSQSMVIFPVSGW